jgi:diguanylate cyclase (GGDEF)-like protein/PAS domain S-box-containing protein
MKTFGSGEKVMQIDFEGLIRHISDGLYMVDLRRKIIYWNKPAEEITGYSAQQVVGHACWENILVHVDQHGQGLCQAMCPLAATIKDGIHRDAQVFLHHRDGHRVPVWVRTSRLQDLSGKVIGGAELFTDLSATSAIANRIKELEKISLIDELTQLANRRYMEMELQGRFAEMKRYGLAFGLILMDIDFFKQVNDRYGHPVGDLVLRAVSKTIQQTARPFDLFGRWGGEEFMGIIRNTDAAGLAAIAERVRILVANTFLEVNSAPIGITISVGATMALATDTPASLVRRTDQLLYQSKARGRNCCSFG